MAYLQAQSSGMAIKSRNRLYGSSVRLAAGRAAEARKQADKLASHSRLQKRWHSLRRRFAN
jgi:hypothetical protein